MRELYYAGGVFICFQERTLFVNIFEVFVDFIVSKYSRVIKLVPN